MDAIMNSYHQNSGLYHFIIGLLIFGGLGRIAFWRDADELRVGGPLTAGLALLLTFAIILWADQEGRSIAEFGSFAAGLVVMAIFIMGWRAFTKSKEL